MEIILNWRLDLHLSPRTELWVLINLNNHILLQDLDMVYVYREM